MNYKPFGALVQMENCSFAVFQKGAWSFQNIFFIFSFSESCTIFFKPLKTSATVTVTSTAVCDKYLDIWINFNIFGQIYSFAKIIADFFSCKFYCIFIPDVLMIYHDKHIQIFVSSIPIVTIWIGIGPQKIFVAHTTPSLIYSKYKKKIFFFSNF